MTSINFEFNGFGNSEKSRKVFSELMHRLPPFIRHANLNNNGLGDYRQLIGQLPETVEFISIQDQSIRGQLHRLKWSANPTENQACMQGALALLNTYIKGNLVFNGLFRTHTTNVREIVASINNGEIDNFDQLIDELNKIHVQNNGGAFASILSVIRQLDTTTVKDLPERKVCKLLCS